MMTFSQIQDDAAARFEGVSGAASQFPLLPRWINQCYHYLNASEDWKWTEKNGTFTLTSGETGVTINSIDPYYRRVLDITEQTSPGQALMEIKPHMLDIFRPNLTVNSSGTPASYFIWNNQFNMYPIPDNTYTFNIRYYASDPDMSLGTDTPNFGNAVQACELLCIWGYKMILQSNFMFDQASEQLQEFQDKLQKLKDTELLASDDAIESVDQLDPSYQYPL